MKNEKFDEKNWKFKEKEKIQNFEKRKRKRYKI